MKTEPIDLDTCTIQEACDYAIKCVVAQGHVCISKGECVYGDDYGNHCVIGWLDPTNDDLMIFEGNVASAIHYGALKHPFFKRHVEVLINLQRVHDVVLFGHSVVHHIDKTLKRLACDGIDTSGPHWQEWRAIAMFEAYKLADAILKAGEDSSDE
jgi:hypothetical protein